MPIKWAALGMDGQYRVVERWFVRRWWMLDVARADMLCDPVIKHISIVRLCVDCGRPSACCLCAQAAKDVAHV